MIRFAELLGRSNFSFLEGASHPEELVERAQQLQLEALALCDRNGVYGSVRLHEAAKEQGYAKVIVGAELTLEPGRRDTVALLVETHAGYSALCRLLTAAHAGHDKGEAGLRLAQIVADCPDLFAILPLDAPAVSTWRSAQIALLREAFGERLALGTWRHLEPLDAPRIEHARRVSAQLGIPIVASARPLYHHRSRQPLADVVRCIRLKTTLDRAGTALTPNAEAELRSGARMRRLFPDQPEWIAHSVAIAERCSFSLDQLHYRFPCEYSDPGLDPDETLRRHVAEGARWRYPGGVPGEVRAQLDKELQLIAQLAVAPFFLSVQEIVDLARERGILCQGRGSAANSAVCFVLGITAVDPARSSLLFERFMSAERAEPPDIDVDFEHERREEVIQEIYRRYGRDRAAMVSEVITYRGKSALREVGKVFGLAREQLDRLSSIASHFNPVMYSGSPELRSPLGEAVAAAAEGAPPAGGAPPPEPPVSSRRRALPEGAAAAECLRQRGLDPNDHRLRQVLALAAQLAGFPRHLSIHVGGFVLSAEPLCHVAPIEPARMPGRTVIPWDKDDIEALGFFKVDVLGLGMLTAIRKALALIQKRSAGAVPFDPIAALAAIPPEDPAVYDAVCQADTIGVFQIESRAQMAMLPVLRPRKFYDLVVEVGIVRPGPIQGKMVHPYLRRRTGEEPVEYPSPALQPILERTLGVPLFQEQVMQIAIVGAGYTGGEADQLRRDMAVWRRSGRLARHREKLLRGFRQRGISLAFGERLFAQILGFGEYGFPESHAASFALLVYASAWLKVHHPDAFACALINSQPMGFYSPRSIVKDAQRHGVEVRPVCVAQSDWDCTLEPPAPAAPPSSRQPLRLGLRLLSGLSRRTAQGLIAARQVQPFGSIDDFVRRAGARRDEVEVLAEAGALESLTPCRRQALWRIRAPREGGIFDGHAIEPDTAVNLPPLPAVEQLALDYGTVGLSLHDHPMRHVRRRLGRRRVLTAAEQQSWRQGQQISVAGMVQSRQRPMTASGIVFITLEDETGTLNLVIYPQVFERYELVARHAGLLLARGQVDRRGEVVHIRVRHLERLDLPRGHRQLALRSRDFH